MVRTTLGLGLLVLLTGCWSLRQDAPDASGDAPDAVVIGDATPDASEGSAMDTVVPVDGMDVTTVPDGTVPLDTAGGDGADGMDADTGMDATADGPMDASTDGPMDSSTDGSMSCPGGRTLCGAACVTLASDPSNCGTCGHGCSVPNATAACTAGLCAIGSCNPGTGDCDGNAANGCEVTLASSPANCGSCGSVCTLANATAGCAAGACTVVGCATNFRDCNGSPGDGCEADTRSSAANCGACGHPCVGSQVCSMGACVLACASGLTNCGGACVDTASDPGHCGSCTTACGPYANGSASCGSAACAMTCNAGFADCNRLRTDGCETDTTSSAGNCAACGHGCTLPNATAGCATSACRILSCATGYADCDGNPANGCEVNIGASATDCGACGHGCMTANATAACSAGSCTIARCNAGYGDCNGTASDGCEVNLGTSPASCGACGRGCALAGTATDGCADGVCTVGSCRSGFGDCDSTAANGCETDLTSSTASCGACGHGCGAGQVCGSGTCTATCMAPLSRCGTGGGAYCANVMTDAANCGACGRTCGPYANASVSCTTGACAMTCNAGFADCNSSMVDGCETDTTSSTVNCGTCGHGCSLPNATAGCAASACRVVSCNAGYGDCDGLVSNGCETALATTVSSCGACGTVCPSRINATTTCAMSSCGYACNAGFGDCDGSPTNGCEANLANTAANCGACGHACATGQTCAGGACVTMCTLPAVACNSGASTVCTDTRTDPVNCGACGTVCALANTTSDGCVTGACTVAACASGFGNCNGLASDGCEANLRTDSSHCGACSVGCTGGLVCVAGFCAPPPAPRLIAPLSTSTVTSMSPVFRWQLATNTTGARVLVCSNRAMSVGCTSQSATGSSLAFIGTLGQGVHYWQANGQSSGSSGPPSGVWEFFVGASSAPVAASSGTVADFNGDGYADVVVGDSLANAVYLYPGATTGLSTSTVFTGPAGSAYGISVASAGDTNGDGYGDLIVGTTSAGTVYVYLGGPSGPGSSALTLTGSGTNRFGRSVASAGDVNGDGYADILVGTPGSATAYVFLGGPSGPAATATLLAGPSGSSFGQSVAGVGDINADGYGDFAIGALGLNTTYVYLGGLSVPTTATTTLTGPAGSGFGAAVAGAGDLNADGYTDMVVGTSASTSVYVYNGASGGLVTTPATLVGPGASTSGFGNAVAGAGDINGDGYGDLVVGAANAYTAYVYLGTGGSLATVTPIALTGPIGSSLGRSVAGAGDISGTGHGDLVVGADGTNTVYVYPGNSGGPGTPPTILTQTPGTGNFGVCVASARRSYGRGVVWDWSCQRSPAGASGWQGHPARRRRPGGRATWRQGDLVGHAEVPGIVQLAVPTRIVEVASPSGMVSPVGVLPWTMARAQCRGPTVGSVPAV